MGLRNGFVEVVGLRNEFVGVGLRNGFSENTKNGCGGMQSNRVEFEQEKMEGATKLEGTSDEAQTGLGIARQRLRGLPTRLGLNRWV